MDRLTQQRVRDRAGNRCEYCRFPQEAYPQRMPIDHVVAIKHGGDDSELNLALSCILCNLHKGTNLAGIDPQTKELTRLFNPRSDSWREHFVWQREELFGLTAVGRTTIAVLSINDPQRALTRALLLASGISLDPT